MSLPASKRVKVTPPPTLTYDQKRPLRVQLCHCIFNYLHQLAPLDFQPSVAEDKRGISQTLPLRLTCIPLDFALTLNRR